MKAKIIQTITCKHCKPEMEFDLVQIFSDLSAGKSGDLRCPICHFASGMKIDSSRFPFLASPESVAQIIKSIELDLNNLLASRLKENGFIKGQLS